MMIPMDKKSSKSYLKSRKFCHLPVLQPDRASRVDLSSTKIESEIVYLKFMHQSIPPAPSPPRANPRELAFFFSWMANSRGLEHLSCQMPGGGDESRGRMPHPRDRFNASFHFRIPFYISSRGSPIL